MEKKVQNYIHFYIGQPCVNSWFEKTHSMYDPGWRLIGIDANAARPYKLESEDDFTWSQEVMPLLRPLSDMTEEERKGIEQFVIYHRDDEENFAYSMGRMTAWLLSHGFDLFGLIAAGVALDKTKRLSESKEGDR